MQLIIRFELVSSRQDLVKLCAEMTLHGWQGQSERPRRKLVQSMAESHLENMDSDIEAVIYRHEAFSGRSCASFSACRFPRSRFKDPLLMDVCLRHVAVSQPYVQSSIISHFARSK